MPSIKIDCPKTNTPFGEIFYPGVEVEVWLPSMGYQAFEFIVDSGADCTVVPRHMANLVGRKLPRKAETHMYGISDRPMACYRGKLQMRLMGEEFETRCLFTASDKPPLLLGRVDFFNIFHVQFDGNNCQMVFNRRII